MKKSLAILLIFAFAATGSLSAKTLDSLPPMHTLKDGDISSITTDFNNQTIQVTLITGTVYLYQDIDWDYENYNRETPARLRDTIVNMGRTFTRAEHAPEFTGGEDAWNQYIADFCNQHSKDIRKKGPTEVLVQFIVHMKGQICDFQVIQVKGNSKLTDLALEAIRNSPPWTPAMQNGRKVVAYKKVNVVLSL